MLFAILSCDMIAAQKIKVSVGNLPQSFDIGERHRHRDTRSPLAYEGEHGNIPMVAVCRGRGGGRRR